MEESKDVKHYTSQFYEFNKDGSYESALGIVPVVNRLFRPKSVIDIGCGKGLWLKVWNEECGVPDIKGVEGSYISKEILSINPDFLQIHDLKQPLEITRRYDLAMTMEVAEHLPESAADQFVATLTSLSDVILFSAAIIGQDGTYHVNEQMPEYWAKKFAAHHYEPIDYLRSAIWTDSRVRYWYKQNVLLFCKRDIIPELPGELIDAHKHTNPDYLFRVHPDHYFKMYNRKNIFKYINYKYYKIKRYIIEH